MLTEGTIQRIKEFVNSNIKQNDNYSSILILEAEPVDEGVPGSGTAKIEIKELKEQQHSDQLFQEYDKNNCDKVRRAFRLPPIFVGKSEDYTRATAEASRKLAEEQVFSPEREDMDRQFTQFFVDLGYGYWEYKSFSPNVTDPSDLTEVLKSTEKTGALTPRIARTVVGEILNRTLDDFEGELPFDPDTPFSLTMADAVKKIAGEQGAALGGSNRTGALAPNQGQIPTPPGVPKEGDALTPEHIDKVANFADELDAYLDKVTGWGASE
jgi:capsid portal protein